MNLFGRVILVCLIISALQGMVAVIAIAIVLLFLWGVLFRTAQTVGLVVMLLLLTALQVHPWLTISAFVGLGVVLLIAHTRGSGCPPEPPTPALPSPDDEPV